MSDEERPHIGFLGEDATQSIELTDLFTRDVTITGSFDIKGDIWQTTFGKLLQALPVPALLINQSYRIIVANQAWEKVGASYERIQDRLFSLLFPTSSAAQKAQSLLEEVFSTRKPKAFEAMVEVDGAKIWGRMTFRSIRIKDKRYILVLVEDLTREKHLLQETKRYQLELESRVEERTAALADSNKQLRQEILQRHRVQDALRRSEEKYRSLFERSRDAIAIITRKGKLLDVNDSFRDLFCLSKKEIPRTNFEELWANPTQRASFQEEIERNGFVKDYVCQIRRKDGEVRDYLITSTRAESERGTAMYEAICRDVTEHKRFEERLRQAAKMEAIGHLAGGIAHDFNNILAGIIGNADFLIRELPSEGSYRDRVAQIIRAADTGATLIQQLLAFGRKQALQMGMLDLNTLVSDFERLLGRLIGENVEIKTACDPTIGTVRADRTQIEQILMNLSINARDAMPNGGILTIETGGVMLDSKYAETYPEVEPGDYVMFAVSDTGHGIDAETLSGIFEPFFTTKEKGVGTGLGLATVHGIVKQHRGHITVYSEVGRGTTFKVYLPRAQEDSKQEEKTEAFRKEMHGTETILVVEDDPIVRDLACEALGLFGYKPVGASDPEEAMAICKNHDGPIHLLLADVILPIMDGRSLYFRLSAKRPEMKVLYMSGYTENFIVQHGVLNPDVHFIRKPFTVDGLGTKVREVLDYVTKTGADRVDA